MQRPYISSPSKTMEILKSANIRLHKSLGQNYLIDTNIGKKIVQESGVRKDDNLLEIGSGIGSLTELLLPECNRIICVEIDKRIGSVFEGLFADYMQDKLLLIQEDALKLDYSDIFKRYKINKVVSNLPYKIAAPLTIKLLLETGRTDGFYFTIQKDIADRMLAEPGDKNYNAFSVKMRSISKARTLFKISSNCFFPKPHVDSVFISIDKDLSIIEGHIKDRVGLLKFFSFIERCFRHRRKKLISALLSYNIGGVDKRDLIVKILSGIGKDKDLRPEDLSIRDFLNIYIELNI